MAVEEYSFHHHRLDFLIPRGTQVVLKASKALADGTVRPPGSVAVIVDLPKDNRHAYTIRFADGQTVSAFFQELAIRRKEVEDQLARPSSNLRPWIIYRCQVGSHAYGLATEDSDTDLRGIYLPPARWHWSLWKLPEQLEYASETQDEVYWELEKFLKLALKANPNVLETLWTPRVLYADPVAQRLREIRQAFLSRYLYRTYSGYVLSQFRLMAKAYARTGTWKSKHAMHLIRLLYSGIDALRCGQIRVDVSEHREELLAIKAGLLTWEEVHQKALALNQQFQEAYQQTRLPEQPDYQQVDQFLIWARRRMVDA
ncbi:MAG: nucleotidyltransferase domain-containing protein [Thermogemmata sp.]|jgi:predicted nucleotidyltransferase|nr:nucleotidyltransferase domain-containing protein [Gemmataceae bacterium]